MSFVTFGEIMMRLTALEHQILRETNSFNISFGGAEANVAIALSGFGLQTTFFTGLPQNDFGEKAIRKLKKYDVDTQYIVKKEGRIGTYFVEEGFEFRPSKIIYDRANSVFSTLELCDFNLEKILKDKKWFHFSGITPAINDEMFNLLENILKIAKAQGLTISCDLNYRASLWDFNTARNKMTKLLPYIDVLFGYEPINLKDKQGRDIKDGLNRLASIEEIQPILKEIHERYNIKYIAFTQRKIFNSSCNRLQGFISDAQNIYETAKYEVKVLDRVGTGDAFTAGIIFGLVEKFALQDVVEFGISNMVYKHTVRGDYNFIDAQTIQSITNSNKEINR
ncbi:PfkB family carbohydrate kinase [Macrococcus animalis]|uniref:PfkB family carbohydrate kinase n=1 Tax=Macrococcus animalis TaxID=3395467 RepID=UPI0039BE09EA